ncbi:cyclic lactone autoinducer peptide [Alkaliphilus sp. B6464]|nr:cyclic lactone autoinducer peptide [Alkaliphilus sp. B6464]QUH19813.1 cyclic lactone autoinducer peptide [Alkaliphilus sp. B6464]
MKKGNILLNVLAVVAAQSANLGAEINCVGFLYQPKCPNRLRKN